MGQTETNQTIGNEYFGVCPQCHKNDGCINVGRSHWFYCKEHRVKWCVGANLFSSWRYQTEDEQRRIYNDLGFGEFQQIEECHPGEKEDMIDITLVPAGSAQRRCCTVCGGLTEKWVGVLAQSDDGIRVCENCLKAGDIDARLEQHVEDLKAYVQKVRSLIGRLRIRPISNGRRHAAGFATHLPDDPQCYWRRPRRRLPTLGVLAL